MSCHSPLAIGVNLGHSSDPYYTWATTHPIQKGGLLATRAAISPPHVDASGAGTLIAGVEGTKLWYWSSDPIQLTSSGDIDYDALTWHCVKLGAGDR